MSEVFNYCHVAELTDKGCKRPVNEDWMTHFESPNGLVAVVCDGMGGHVGGKTASHTAVEAIQQFMMQERGGTPFELIIEAMNVASSAILSKAAQQPELTGMGATCVMLIVRDGKVYIGSVGDSRVYLIRNRKIKQLTKDQSYVQMLLDAGSITPEQAEHHPRKNEITNALGLKGMQPATVLSEAINPDAGDCFLLCSDGLSGMVPDSEICKVVSRQADKSQQERVEELILRAKRNGGVDNITCQIVEFSVSPNAKAIQPWWKKNMWALIGCVAAILLFVFAILWLMRYKKGDTDEQKHSETVNQLMSTVDSVYTLKRIPYTKGNVFLELTEDRDFGGIKLRERLSSGDTTVIIKHPISIRRMEVTPASCISVKYLDEDSTKCFLSFEKELGDEKEVTITLRGEKSFLYILPLLLTEHKADNRTNTTAQVASAKKTGDVSEKEYGSPSEDTADQGATGTDELPVSECTVDISGSKANQKITLWSQAGTNTKTEMFFREYAFTDTGEHDHGWYSVKNNGHQCVITIKNTPQDPIPMSARDAVIYIRTQPSCNDGKGIILRIRKLNQV